MNTLIRKCICCERTGCNMNGVKTWCNDCTLDACYVAENNIKFDITSTVCIACREEIKKQKEVLCVQ